MKYIIYTLVALLLVLVVYSYSKKAPQNNYVPQNIDTKDTQAEVDYNKGHKD